VSGKTREIAKIGRALSVSCGLIISGSDDFSLRRSIRNIPGLVYNNVNRISGRDVFYSKNLIITESALTLLNERYSEVGR